MALLKAKFTFGSPFRETLSEAKSRLLNNFLLRTLLPRHLQCVHGIFLVHSAAVDVNWQDNRCDTKSDVIAVLLGGLICQWNLQITFRSNASEHTWQPPFLPLNTWCFPAWQTLGAYLHSKIQVSVFPSFQGRDGQQPQSWISSPSIWKMQFENQDFPCSLLQIRQSTKADVA